MRHTKFTSLILSALILFTNVVFANTLENNFWTERKKSLESMEGNLSKAPSKNFSVSTLNLATLNQTIPAINNSSNAAVIIQSFLKPLKAGGGNIQRILIPPLAQTGKAVIQIQDIHLNSEAQNCISKTISSLIQNKQIGLIALEGAFAPIQLKPFQIYPDQKSIHLVAKHLLKENKISGPIYSLLNSGDPNTPPVVGIDDASHYEANVAAYKTSAEKQKIAKIILADHQNSIDDAKAVTLNPRLSDFDLHVEQYRKDKIPFGQYLKYLSTQTKDQSPSVKNYLEALDLESTLDFKKAEIEQPLVLNKLVNILPKKEVEALLKTSVAFKTGEIQQGDFYRNLNNLCLQHRVDLSSTKDFKNFIHYMVLAGEMDSEIIMREARTLEMKGYENLFENDGERQLVLLSKHAYLLNKLVDFSLTNDEWEDYKTLKDSIKPRSETPNGLSLASFEKFYAEAEIRDQLMAKNLFQAMDEFHARTAVLVTGGFHTKGIQQSMEKAGLASVSYIPKVSTFDGAGNSYLNVFLKGKTPLEKLFSGEALFLAQNPAAPPTLQMAKVETVGAGALNSPTAMPPTEVQKNFTQLVPGGVETLEIFKHLEGNKVAAVEARVEIPGQPEAVSVQITPIQSDEIKVTQRPVVTNWWGAGKNWLKAQMRAEPLRKLISKNILPLTLTSLTTFVVSHITLAANMPLSTIIIATSGTVFVSFYAYKLFFTFLTYMSRVYSFHRLAIFLMTLCFSLFILGQNSWRYVMLAWDPSAEAGIIYYKVYAVNHSMILDGQFSGPRRLVASVTNQTTVTLQVPSDELMYYVVTAVKSGTNYGPGFPDMESGPSLQIAYGPTKLLTTSSSYNSARTVQYFRFVYPHIVGKPYRIETSVDLMNWTPASNAVSEKIVQANPNSDASNIEYIYFVAICPVKDPKTGKIVPNHFFRGVQTGGMMQWIQDKVLPGLWDWATSNNLPNFASTIEKWKNNYWFHSSWIENGLSYMVGGIGYLVFALGMYSFTGSFHFDFQTMNQIVWLLAFPLGHTSLVSNRFGAKAPFKNFVLSVLLGGFNIFLGLHLPMWTAISATVLTHLTVNTLIRTGPQKSTIISHDRNIQPRGLRVVRPPMVDITHEPSGIETAWGIFWTNIGRSVEPFLLRERLLLASQTAPFIDGFKKLAEAQRQTGTKWGDMLQVVMDRLKSHSGPAEADHPDIRNDVAFSFGNSLTEKEGHRATTTSILSDEAREMRSPHIIYPFLPQTKGPAINALNNLAKQYLTESQGRIFIEAVVSDPDLATAVQEWITAENQTHIHVILRANNENMVQIQVAAAQNIQKLEPSKDIMETARFQLLVTRGTNLGPNFMDGITKDVQNSRFQMFIWALTDTLNSLAVEFKSNDLSHFKDLVERVLSQA